MQNRFNEIKWEEVDHRDFTRLVEDIYQNGLSCLDFIDYIMNLESFDELKKSRIYMYFEKIKSEYRCEQLLMFTLLDYIYIRNDQNICF